MRDFLLIGGLNNQFVRQRISLFRVKTVGLIASSCHSWGLHTGACHCQNLREENISKETKDDSSWWNNLGSYPDDVEKSTISKLGRKKCYVKDTVVGRKFVDAVLKNRVNSMAPILDIQAGPGIVSSEFLHQGVCQVVALEKRSIFKTQLQAVKKEFGSQRFSYFKWNMLNFFYKFNDLVKVENYLTYRKFEKSVVEVLSKSPYTNSDTPYSIISTGGRGGRQENENVIFYIVRNMPHEDKILSTGRVEYFLIVHPKLKASVESLMPLNEPSRHTRHFSYFHTFITLLYDIAFIEEFHVNDFVPPFHKMKWKRDLDVDKRYLMKMQIKENISKILPFEQHNSFSIFLRHIFQKRSARIIPGMEMLVNGCGIRMLAEGFTMMDTIMDVAPDRLLQLYKSMLTWPEYSASHLKNHIDMKTQGGSVEDLRSVES